mmetsp:Transcript_34574/g.103321  ORF Transcript_34574/g.103321 Transcript_34574/m.103321 type:complete len:207 (+) Transcript_34574:1037-1657(+)
MSKESSQVQNRSIRLRELAEKCNEHAHVPVKFELFSFSVGAVVKEGVVDSTDELINCIISFEYDGGTDFEALKLFFSQLAQRESVTDAPANDTAGIDSVLVFTDGMDNFGATPHFDNFHRVPFPVHVIADTNEVNLRCAQSLASLSPQYPGRIFTKKDESYVPGVLYKSAVLKSIKTDQSEDAFMEDFDDGSASYLTIACSVLMNQ